MSLLTLKDPFASDFPSFLEATLPAPAAFGASTQPSAQRADLAEAKQDAEQDRDTTTERTSNGPGRKRARRDANSVEVALCGGFSGGGSYVATGMARTGYIAIRDLMTRHVITVHRCHEASVTSVSYLPNEGSRLLLTSSAEGEVAILDLKDFHCHFRWRQRLPVSSAAIARRTKSSDPILCLVCRSCTLGQPQPQPQSQAVRKDEKTSASTPADEDAVPWPLLLQIDLEQGTAVEHQLKWDLESGEKPPRSVPAAFSTDGECVYVGGASGTVHVFETATRCRVASERPVQSAKRMGWTKRIVASKAKIVLAQANDKVIHMMRAEDRKLTHVQDFQDSVENIKWACCDVSPDGEYIIAGCANGHVLHVWNVLGRHMAKLFAPDRGLVRQVLWHPRRPMVLSLGRDGQMLVWATHRSESWTAFAPNFVELEENESYHEREDEFDRNPRHGEPRRGSISATARHIRDEDAFVDIVTVDRDADDLEPEEFPLPLRLAPPAEVSM
ncbi:Retinoblastoma-binding protein 5 [Hondaea fermentalgiana]|uniref:Retinoblastoma-binding protein 5 n=1 Tax=Hondaea fermentalgiana TaxID=2315210 RepID=A0A2R5G7I2_9STRA|nr:Retinoblastoma-binding protein 5 [Hondaea fermentalgiana]|eukprot:GBG27012.1 Retinoblastoma-binding protein 5 [Hondaea fermentalgiana]